MNEFFCNPSYLIWDYRLNRPRYCMPVMAMWRELWTMK